MIKKGTVDKTNAAFSIIELPPKRAKEYRELRLEALKRDPLAFGSSYEEEVSRPLSFWRERLENSKKGLSKTFFAEVDGRLVGIIGVFPDHHRKMRHVAYIYAVYVEPKSRGKGIAKALYAAAETFARKKKIEKIRLEVVVGNAAALALYLSVGFKVVATFKREYKIGQKYYDQTVMEKLL